MSAVVTCRELVELLADYLDGELAPEVRETFDDHLARCPSCVSYLNSYRTTLAVTKAAFKDPGMAGLDDVPEDLLRAILAARRN